MYMMAESKSVLDMVMRGLSETTINNTGGEYEYVAPGEINLWFVGVFLYSFGAFCMAMGVILQKYSINLQFSKQPDPSRHAPKIRQPLWVLGIIMYGSSGGLLSAALGFAPQSMLTPLMSLVIIFNAILARFLLNEPLTKRDFFSVCVIVVAVILTTSTAPFTDDKFTTEELIELYQQPLFIVFITVLLSVMLSFYCINYYVRWLKKNHKRVTKTKEFLFAFSYGASAGCWGGLCVTMIKSAILLFVDKANTDGVGSIFKTGILYGLLLVLCTCWYMQLNWINKGLERYPAVFIVSIEAVLNEVVAVSGGILYFQEYKKFTLGRGFGFGIGLLIGVGGVIMFALRDNTVPPEKDFFTNSPTCKKCGCKCCDLVQLDMDKEAKMLSQRVALDPLIRPGTTASTNERRKSVKSLISGNEVIYLDENGNETVHEEEDHIVVENIQSPLSLAVDGVVGVGKYVAKHRPFSVNRTKADALNQERSRQSFHHEESEGGTFTPYMKAITGNVTDPSMYKQDRRSNMDHDAETL